MNPRVAIIILNWNAYQLTSTCLNSVKRCDYDNYFIVVVDNGSDDDSGTRINAEHKVFKYIENNTNLGFAGGNNVALQYLIDKDFDYVMLLNNDTLVEPDFLSRLVEGVESQSNLGAIQPKILLNSDRKVIWNAGGYYWPFFALSPTRGLGKKDVGQYNEAFKTDWISGCCILLPLSVVKEIGLLDERFFAYYEDLDWSFKITKLGYKLLYYPEAVIYHEAGGSDKNWGLHDEGNVSPFSRYLDIRNHLFIVRRYTRGLNLIGAVSYQSAKILVYFVYYLVRRRTKKMIFLLKGIKDGLLTNID